MKYGTLRKIEIDGAKINAEYIGRGMFCRAYRVDSTVYLLCTGDYSKECVALFCDTSLRHIPTIKRHETWGDYHVYSMPFYAKLTKAKYPIAWEMWKTLPPSLLGFDKANELIGSEKIPKSIRIALRNLVEAYANYASDSMLLEFNKANVGVEEKSGSLILRDCLADMSSVDKIRKEKRKKRGLHD